jgi:hypothetical protein
VDSQLKYHLDLPGTFNASLQKSKEKWRMVLKEKRSNCRCAVINIVAMLYFALQLIIVYKLTNLYLSHSKSPYWSIRV